MMIGCSLPRSCRLLGVLSCFVLLASCGGNADVAIAPGPGPGPGPRLTGQVLTGPFDTPVGRNVVVGLIQIAPTDVRDHDISEALRVVASNSTNDFGQYEVTMPFGTDASSCMFLVQVGTRADGTRTRAFVHRMTGLNISSASEAVVRLILAQIPPANLCDFTATDIGNVLIAVQEDGPDSQRAREAVAAAEIPPTGLALGIQSDDSSITIDDASAFPLSGAVQIGDERMTYTDKSDNTLTGVTRGAFGSSAVRHDVGETVNLISAPPAPPATRTPTPTPTNTAVLTPPTLTPTIPLPPPTATSTASPTATQKNPPTPTSTLPPNALRIAIGHGQGEVGQTVRIDVSLESNGQNVAGAQNDILFDPALVNLNKTSDCKINPDIGDRLPACDDDPQTAPCKQLQRSLADCPGADGCPDGSDGLKRFRGIILSTANVNTIPDGVLYTCTFTVTGDVFSLAELQNRTAGASDAEGNPLTTVADDGSVTVLGPTPTAGSPTETPTMTPTVFDETPTRTPTHTSVPTDTPLPTNTPTFVATNTPVPPTNTPLPTDTVTPLPTATDTPIPTDTPTLTPTPAPAQVNVGTVSGAAGTTVSVPVSLVGNGASLSAVANDIGYDPTLVEVALSNGKPDCQADARLAGVKAAFGAVLDGAGGMKILRVGLIGTDNNTELTDGVLYTCRFTVNVSTPTQVVTLTNTSDGSNPDGEAVVVEGDGGTIDVTGAPPALDLAMTSAGAGATVPVTATLSTRDQNVSAVSADIDFASSLLSVAVDGDGNPDCMVDAGIGPLTELNKQVFARVLGPDGEGTEILRVGVIAPDNGDSLPDGVTFTCNFVVAADAGQVSIVLGNTPDGSTPGGEQIGLIGGDGAITVQ